MKKHVLMLSPIAAVGLICLPVGCASRDQDAASPVVRVDQPVAEQPAAAEPLAAKPAVPPATVKAESEARPEPSEPVAGDTRPAAVMPTQTASTTAPPPASGGGKSLPTLREELAASTNPDATLELLDTIGRRRGAAREALPDLVSLTTASDPRIRWHAARSIGLIGEDAIAEIPTLLELLQDADPVVATQAAAAIGHIREDDNRDKLPKGAAEAYDEAVTQLIATLVHNDPRVRRACLRALRRLDPDPEQVMPVVDGVFAGNDPAVILPALSSIADMEAAAVPFLVERLKRPQGRYWASVALTEIGPAAAAAVPALVEALAESPPEEQLQEVLALAAIGEPAGEAGDSLIALYAEGEPSLRGVVLYALGKLKVAKAEPLLTEVVATESDQLAATAAWARVKLDPANEALVDDAVERLLKQCESTEEFARAAAVSALSDLAKEMDGESRKVLAQQFGQLLKDPSDRVHDTAAAALIRLGGDATTTATERLTDPVTELPALRILAAIGSPADDAVGPVAERLSADSPELVTEAILALAAMGSAAAPTVDQLLPLLADVAAELDDDQSRGVRYAAAYCLGRIGAPAAKPALERLAELAESDDQMLSTVAIWASLQIEPENQERFKQAVPKLTMALQADSQTVRLEAAIALGDLGSRAKDAEPALELLAEDDPIRNIRDAAREALRKIRGG